MKQYFNHKIYPIKNTIIIRKINIEIAAIDSESGIQKVELFIDDQLKKTFNGKPYIYIWNERAFFQHNIKIKAYDDFENYYEEEINVWKFF